MIFFVYFAPTPPASAFRGLENIQPVFDTTATQSYVDIVNAHTFHGFCNNS